MKGIWTVNPPLIQGLLKAGRPLKSIAEQFKLDIRYHTKYPNLVLVKYNQLESPFAERLVRECRGLILDLDQKAEVIARPFDKFFNYGEGLAAKIDWTTAKVQEKLDGSLCYLYWYDAKWHVATSGSPDASGPVGAHDFSFAELFWRVYEEKGYQLPKQSFGMLTFMFELTTPFNRVVVDHKSNDLKLIGLRYNLSGSEWPVGDFIAYEPVRSFDISSFEGIQDSFWEMDPLKQEGYVVVDREFNRVKVKHPGYVALHHLKSGFSPRKIVEIVRSNESSEVLSSFPEWADYFDKTKQRYNDLVAEIEAVWMVHESIEDQKEFALAIKHLPYSGILFAMRKGNIATVKEGLKKSHIDNVTDLLRMFN